MTATPLPIDGHALPAAPPTDTRQIEVLYDFGYRLYQSARYEDALTIFRYLLIVDDPQARFLLAHGKTLQQLGRYLEAGVSYAMAHVRAPTDPQPLLLSAQCMVATGDLDDARDLLQDVVAASRAKGDDALRARAEQMMVRLTKPSLDS